MNEIARHLEVVKNQIDYFKFKAKQLGHKTPGNFAERIREFEQLSEFLVGLKTHSVPNSSQIGKRIGGTDDLPDEILKQLVSAVDEQATRITNVLETHYGGVASVDEILVGLYREYGIVEDRRKLAAKLYRMIRDEALFSHEKKGVYSSRSDLEEKTVGSEHRRTSPDQELDFGA